MLEPQFFHLRIDLMSWTQYRDALAGNPLVFLPVGALEQHGPHLPMGCDAIFATAIASRAAARMNGLVMPTLAYGYKSQARSGGGQSFPGTTSLDGHTLGCQTRDILRELLRHGARDIVIINGHVENQWFVTEGIDLALRERPDLGNDVKVVRCEYWSYTPQTVLTEIFAGDFPGVDLEHAALLETSMMLALHPELVRRELIPDGPLASFPLHDSYPDNGRRVPKSGVLAPAGQASADKGQRLIDSTVSALVEGLLREFPGSKAT